MDGSKSWRWYFHLWQIWAWCVLPPPQKYLLLKGESALTLHTTPLSQEVGSPPLVVGLNGRGNGWNGIEPKWSWEFFFFKLNVRCVQFLWREDFCPVTSVRLCSCQIATHFCKFSWGEDDAGLSFFCRNLNNYFEVCTWDGCKELGRTAPASACRGSALCTLPGERCFPAGAISLQTTQILPPFLCHTTY